LSLERYRVTAEQVVEEHGIVGQHGMGELVLGIQQAIQGFVEHELEWAALSLEDFVRHNTIGLSRFAEDRLTQLAEVIRQRGRA